MIKTLLYAALGAGAVGGASICGLCPQTAGAMPPAAAIQQQVASAAQPRTATLHVDGMTCGGCVIGVQKVLSRLDGVTKADVSYEKTRAVVTYDPAKVTVNQMIAAIRTLGYKATLVTS